MEQKYTEISDLGLAAALVTSGFSVVELNRDNPRRTMFVFENSNSLDSCVDAYWSGELVLSAIRLLDQQKQLKSRIYG